MKNDGISGISVSRISSGRVVINFSWLRIIKFLKFSYTASDRVVFVYEKFEGIFASVESCRLIFFLNCPILARILTISEAYRRMGSMEWFFWKYFVVRKHLYLPKWRQYPFRIDGFIFQCWWRLQGRRCSGRVQELWTEPHNYESCKPSLDFIYFFYILFIPELWNCCGKEFVQTFVNVIH